MLNNLQEEQQLHLEMEQKNFEIDTGISGKAAQSVAKKLKQLSKKKQIIVITHLPVVAAMGDSHFHISKSEKDLASFNILLLFNASSFKSITSLSSLEVISSLREAVTSSIDALSDGEITASELIEKSIRTINSISNMSQDAQKAEEFIFF